jgi:hypothetical protein
MKMMKSRNADDRRKPDDKKNVAPSSCVQHAAELLGVYTRILSDLRRESSLR